MSPCIVHRSSGDWFVRMRLGEVVTEVEIEVEEVSEIEERSSKVMSRKK